MDGNSIFSYFRMRHFIYTYKFQCFGCFGWIATLFGISSNLYFLAVHRRIHHAQRKKEECAGKFGATILQCVSVWHTMHWHSKLLNVDLYACVNLSIRVRLIFSRTYEYIIVSVCITIYDGKSKLVIYIPITLQHNIYVQFSCNFFSSLRSYIIRKLYTFHETVRLLVAILFQGERGATKSSKNNKISTTLSLLEKRTYFPSAWQGARETECILMVKNVYSCKLYAFSDFSLLPSHKYCASA